MPKNIKGDIFGMLEYMPITLLSNKINVGIIGGGRAAFIKAKTFKKNGANVEVIALDFKEEFKEIDVKCIKNKYEKEFIKDKHLIVIAVDDLKVVQEIIKHCEEEYKIYINSTCFSEGMAIIPVKRESDNILISVNTKNSNPKGTVLIANSLEKTIRSYDEFIKYTTVIRNNLNIDKSSKMELLSFINSEDFKFMFEKGKADNIIQMFYPNLTYY